MTNTPEATHEATHEAINENLPGAATYRGSCVCGAVRFEADIDLSAGTTRCNCTLCTKAGLWGVTIAPSAFRLLAGADNLADFQRGARIGHFIFCKTCGAHPFGHGDAPWMNGPYVSVQLTCLDDADLSDVPVRYFDGRNDNWENPHVERAPARMVWGRP